MCSPYPDGYRQYAEIIQRLIVRLRDRGAGDTVLTRLACIRAPTDSSAGTESGSCRYEF
jgi:hypothetical protein